MQTLFGNGRDRLVLLAVCTAALAAGASGASAAQSPEGGQSAVERAAAAVGVSGGLCVQIGAEKTDLVAELAKTGRFLVQVLDADESLVDRARDRLQAAGLYGLVSVDRLPKRGGLPYTENLVNLLFVSSQASADVSPEEAFRVLCPNGVLVVGSETQTAAQLKAAGMVDVQAMGRAGAWLVATKPRPAEMDEWSHPRHSASGNAASHDALVAPPRRVRWVAGAESEVRGMITASGRNFYAGVLSRDAFNGLRLWNRDVINPSPDGRFTMKNLGSANAPPVADGDRLYVVESKKLLALDAATGATIREYPEAGEPKFVLLDAGTLIAVTGDSVRALDADSAALKWTFSAVNPRYVVAGDDTVALVHGQPQRGQAVEAVVLDAATGSVRWKRSDLAWLPQVTRTVYYRGFVTFEVSTLNDDGPENAIHIVSAADGKVELDHPFLPGMNHRRQARAMFVDDRLWLLHGGKDANKKKLPIEVSALDFHTGEVLVTHPAGLTHCFPPVMTCRYMISGEFDLTDLRTGKVDAHQITKAACGPDGGWVPANGLIYVTPKHCVCWPMLRGYTALASERPAGSVADMDLGQLDFPRETGVDPADAPAADAPAADDRAWPCYRHDPWRSGSTPSAAPSRLEPLWSVDLGAGGLAGPIVEDWRENLFVKGLITSPVVAGNRVVVARPDAHEVIGLDADEGTVAWRFTASGRVDTAPTLHKGLCLFGTKSGWVYALRVDDGRMVWRLRAAPLEEQIVAYGQLESPWPVPGSVLVDDDVAYFAAGRQSLADGGILVFAVEPANGEIRWVKRLDTVPQQGFYECSGLEFDNFDLLHREGDGVGMSRWVFSRETGEMSLDPWAAFAKLSTGKGAAMVPRGCWSYAPRHQRRIPSFTPLRPSTVFRDNVLFGCLQGTSTLYRRDYNLEGGEPFDTKWITGWAASGLSREGKMPWPSHRLAEKASWKVDVFDKPAGTSVDAMVLAGDRLLVAGSGGELQVLSSADGGQIARRTLPPPLWDGMVVALGRLYYATRQGQLLCLGE
ncbi:MAG: outer membrane protein assembly factor BamB family protein [Planctomycetota bacterium]|jgi:outer membrane protein assembly factor BamB